MQIGLVFGWLVNSDRECSFELVERLFDGSNRVPRPVVLALGARSGDVVAVCILGPFWERLRCKGLVGVLFAPSLDLKA